MRFHREEAEGAKVGLRLDLTLLLCLTHTRVHRRVANVYARNLAVSAAFVFADFLTDVVTTVYYYNGKDHASFIIGKLRFGLLFVSPHSPTIFTFS